MPTYDPEAKTKYFIDAGELEDWLREQYDVPSFNVPSDLEEYASPDGGYSVSVDGELSDYDRRKLDEFFEDVEEAKTERDSDDPLSPKRYLPPDTRMMTGRLLNKLAADGHIPEGDYVVEMSF